MKYTYTVYKLQVIICWFRLISLYNCRSRSQEAAPSLRGRNTPGIEGIPDLTAEQLTCSGSGAMPQAPVAEHKMCWVQPKKNDERLGHWKSLNESQPDTLLVQACFGGKILTNTYQINVVSVDGNTGTVDLKVLQKSICHCFDAQIGRKT